MRRRYRGRAQHDSGNRSDRQRRPPTRRPSRRRGRRGPRGHPQPCNRRPARRVHVVAGDPSRPDTFDAAIDAALRGVTGLFINARAVRDAAGALVARARERGVRRVVSLAAVMVAHGFAEPFVTTLLALQAAAAGKPAVTTSEVDKILGRPARTFAEWASDHTADFQ